MEFVESIEEWRNEMKIEKMALLGHSLGGYVASAYSLKYPEKIEHLFLVDPWGFPEENEQSPRMPTWVKAIDKIWSSFNPLAVVRAAGPWGPGWIKRFVPDLRVQFKKVFDDNTFMDYIYHCNAQNPSGEDAFRMLYRCVGFAKRPMKHRVDKIDKHLPITFIFGGHTWLDCTFGTEVADLRKSSQVNIETLDDAGHHPYADKPDEFNNIMKKYLDQMDLHAEERR